MVEGLAELLAFVKVLTMEVRKVAWLVDQWALLVVEATGAPKVD